MGAKSLVLFFLHFTEIYVVFIDKIKVSKIESKRNNEITKDAE